MKNKRTITIYLDGEFNMNLAEKMCNNRCYYLIKDNDNIIAQLEPVLPYGDKNAPQGLTVVSYIEPKNTSKALSLLKIHGFCGYCEIVESVQISECYAEEKTLCGIKL